MMEDLSNLECVITQLHGKGGRAICVDTMDQVYLARSLCQLLIALGYNERERVDLDVQPNANKENKYIPWVAMHLSKKENVVPLAAPKPQPAPTAIAEQFCGLLEEKQKELDLKEEEEKKCGDCSREDVKKAMRDLGGFASTREVADALGLAVTANVRTHLMSLWQSDDLIKISVNRYGRNNAGRTYWARDYDAINYVMGE